MEGSQFPCQRRALTKSEKSNGLRAGRSAEPYKAHVKRGMNTHYCANPWASDGRAVPELLERGRVRCCVTKSWPRRIASGCGSATNPSTPRRPRPSEDIPHRERREWEPAPENRPSFPCP